MKRLILSFALAIACAASTVTAASLPSGTIDCQLAGNDDSPYGLRFIPSISNAPSPNRIAVKDNEIHGSCDASGVTGGKAPITNVEAKLLAKLAAGSTCVDVVTGPHFERLKLKLKWTNVDGTGRKRVVATSAAHAFVGSYDDASEALVFTAQILKGAFAGSGVTMRLTLDNAAFMEGPCPPITGIFYGIDGESMITVP